MDVSWFKRVRDFKSPLRVVSAILLRSRETKARRCEELQQEVDELREQREAWVKTTLRLEQNKEQLGQEILRLKAENTELANRTVVLRSDPPVGTHSYGAYKISLAVNLAQKLGFRGAEIAMQIIFEWLGVSEKIPCATCIRMWMPRWGVAAITKPVAPVEDMIWLVDHSNQIGTEKLLVVLGVRASELPVRGETLKHEDVRVLMVKPGTSWKKEDMAAAYVELKERVGAPRAILADGAPELHDGAETLKTQRPDTILLRDFKHHAANAFKSLIGNCERFIEFNKLVGQTRSAIQQTELSHLVPPSIRQKARFMNLEAVLGWAACLLWLLNCPKAKSRKIFTSARLETKLGWIRSFATEIALWNECQKVISQALTFVNTHGLFKGIAEQLRIIITADLTSPISRDLTERLIKFVSDAETQLKPNERLWLSTEILESTFSLYKQLERQHSKGGFTSLIAAFGGLPNKATPENVREAFSRVSVNDVKVWVKTNLGTTLNSKRRAIYNEFCKKRATI